MKDPATGRQTVVQTSLGASRPYDWAVCHAGSWIRHKRHYVWAASCRRRHIDPVRWVKSGHIVAFVPLHPYDVKGRPPINIKHEVFAVSGKSEIMVRPIRLEPDRAIVFLDSAPREYRVASMRPLTRLEAPHMEAHTLGYAVVGKAAAMARPAVPLRFDPHSLSFAMQKQEMRGGRIETSFAPIMNRNGTLQSRGESFSGGSGVRGNASASSGSHGSVSPGGGSHSGGGSASSGSHSSGGGGSSSTSSASNSSSSSGGSHH